jgi:hypothetical protein
MVIIVTHLKFILATDLMVILATHLKVILATDLVVIIVKIGSENDH